MTHRIELTTAHPDGTLRTVGVDLTGDAADPHDPTLLAFLALHVASALKRCKAAVQHQRGPFGVPTQGTRP